MQLLRCMPRVVLLVLPLQGSQLGMKKNWGAGGNSCNSSHGHKTILSITFIILDSFFDAVHPPKVGVVPSFLGYLLASGGLAVPDLLLGARSSFFSFLVKLPVGFRGRCSV